MATKSETKAEYPHAGMPLPARIDQPDSFFHAPEAVRDWLGKLPLASPLECAKSLFQTLFEMNRMNLDCQERISLLEDMLGPIESVVANLKSKYSATPFPLSDKNRKIALLTRELLKEVAIGYKVAIADQIDSGRAASERDTHIIALHRSLTYLHRVMFHSYIIYEAYPQHSWQEMHLLFTYSSINKLDRVPVVDEHLQTKQSTTVKQVYIQALLLSAASPYQLRQRETDSLCDELVKLVPLAKLSIRHVQDTQNDIGFLINLHSDKPPIPLAYAPRQKNRQLFILDTRLLLEKIQLSLAPNPDSGSDSAQGDNAMTISTHLKQLLLKNWGHAPHRQYVRTRLNFDLNLAIGLNQIHEFLEAGHSKPAAKNLFLGQNEAVGRPADHLQRSSLFATESEDDDITVLTMENYNTEAPNTGTFLSTQKIEKDLEIDAGELATPQAPVKIKTREFKTLNESTGGYCVEWPEEDAPKIRVGELIGIQSATQAVEFGLAITRWLKNLPDNTLLVGIEILSHNCKAVKARVDKVVPKHVGATWYPALTVAQTNDNPAYLVTQSDLFNESEVLLTVNLHEVEERQKLLKLIESTGLFSQFEISTLPPLQHHDAAAPLPNEPIIT